MRIALAQMDIHAGDITYNLNTMKRMIDQAILDKADLIIFPEMCVSGYLIGDRFLQAETVEYLSGINQTIKQWSKDIGIIWGNIYSDKTIRNNRDGRFNRFNAAFFAYQGQWVKKENFGYEGVYFKHCLPDYRFFDDSRYFKSGVDLALEKQVTRDTYISPFIFEKDQVKYKIGLEICEDLWSKDYVVNPTEVYARHNVDYIVNISSSPWTLNKEISRHKRIQEHVESLKSQMVPIIYVNACGMQNNGKNVLLFDGDSALFDKTGVVKIECNDAFKEELLVVDTKDTHLIKHTSDKLRLALIEGIRQFDQQVLKAQMPWIIGMSGGIDSCVNTVLLVYALGKERVIGYNMASHFNQSKTISIAHQLASDLGIEYHEGSIEALVQSTQTSLSDYDLNPSSDGLAYENIQARIRGHLLSSFASYKQGVVCNNGNKVEFALGYATLYGDLIGALSPLGDLTKLQIFDLARSLNTLANKPLIYAGLLPDSKHQFEINPSAELKANQVDPMKWGYHDYLVQLFTQYPSHHFSYWLTEYLNGNWKKSEVYDLMVYYGLDDPKVFVEDFKWFTKSWQKAIFKRIQSPPLITISRGSFGYDYRESQMALVDDDLMNELYSAILKLPRP